MKDVKMAFRPPPKILQKVMGFRSIKYEDGGVLIWGVPMTFDMLSVEAIKQNIMVKKFGKKETESLIYCLGRLQAYNGVKVLCEKFGYAKTSAEKENVLKFNTGQLDIIGRGHFEFLRMDFKNNVFHLKGTSPFAKMYKSIYGVQTIPVDFFMRGLITGCLEYITGKELLTIENHCMASGKPYCLFTTKAIKDWNLKSKDVKGQLIDEIRELNVKKI